MMLFTLTQKVIINFGYFLKKLCHQDLSKIAQSGHTDYKLNFKIEGSTTGSQRAVRIFFKENLCTLIGWKIEQAD